MSVSIMSLNVRGLRKNTHLAQNNIKHSHFHSWLGRRSATIMAFQEIQYSTPPSSQDITTIHNILKAHDGHWSQHCGLIVRDADLQMSKKTTWLDGRIITADIRSKNSPFLATIVVIYAPANHQDRGPFFKSLLTLPFFQNPPQHFLLMGDLNYNHFTSRRYPEWQDWIDVKTIDCVNRSGATPLPTFHRPNPLVRSTLDYIFCSPSLYPHTTSPGMIFTNNFSDHDALTVTIVPSGRTITGRGLWRLNTSLLEDTKFLEIFLPFLETLKHSRYQESTQNHWDRIKRRIKGFCITESIPRARHRRTMKNQLLEQRTNRLEELIQSSGSQRERLEKELTEIENDLSSIENHELHIQALRSGYAWREQGERCTAYFFRSIASRQKKRLVPPLRNEETGLLSSTVEEQLGIAKQFYSKLYTPDPIDQGAIDTFLDAIPTTARVSPDRNKNIMAEFSSQEIEETTRHLASGKAPGKDGIPYEMYRILFTIPWITELFIKLANSALQRGNIPRSWKETVMILLFKKGESDRLGNWRPLSLINADAKIFTKILSRRMRPALVELTGEYQVGFTAGRFIADNGLAVRALTEYAKNCQLPHVGLLLDQEKAYDRVHPEYLSKVLERFGFTRDFIRCILFLFFRTTITLNINGHLATVFEQKRGLRQGDPLSPLLYNLIFEPLLAYIIKNQGLTGIAIPGRQDAIKVSAFADDLFTMVKSTQEWNMLQQTFDLYGQASNARINWNKTVAFPLSRTPEEGLKTLLLGSGVRWHDSSNEEHLTYLGFPITLSKQQERTFWTNLSNKTKTIISIHSARSLSILGRGTIANSIILAKLWHVLWTTPCPDWWIQQLRKDLSAFMSPFKPRASWEIVTTPRTAGGLGVIHPLRQAQAFQARHIANMISDRPTWGRQIILDLIRWRGRAKSALEVLVNPSPHTLNIFRQFPTIKNLLKVAQLLPPARTLFTDGPLPMADTILRLPIRWWIPKSDESVDKIEDKVGDVYRLENRDQGQAMLVTKAPNNCRLQRTRDTLHLEVFLGKRTMSQEFQRVLQRTSTLIRGDDLQTRLQTLSIENGTDKKIPLSKASTRLLRAHFTPQRKPPDPTSRFQPEEGSKSQWGAFWKLKIPHQARNFWWRYKQDRLPCGTVRQAIWNQPSCCEAEGCHTLIADKNHFVFHCAHKYNAWQEILSRYTTKDDWPDQDLYALLTFKPPQVSIAPGYDITIDQLTACCLVGIHTANITLYREDITMPSGAIVKIIENLIARLNDQHSLMSSRN